MARTLDNLIGDYNSWKESLSKNGGKQPNLRLNPDFQGRSSHMFLDVDEMPGMEVTDFLVNAFFMKNQGAADNHPAFEIPESVWVDVVNWFDISEYETIENVNVRLLPFYRGIEVSYIAKVNGKHPRGACATHNLFNLQPFVDNGDDKLYQIFLKAANMALENRHPELVGQTFRCGTVEAPMLHEIMTQFVNTPITIRKKQ